MKLTHGTSQIDQESQDGYESNLLQEKAHWIKLWAATVISLTNFQKLF